jgi:hypothetical protein
MAICAGVDRIKSAPMNLDLKQSVNAYALTVPANYAGQAIPA